VPQALPFTSPWLLAPMEGVTDRAFRGLVLARSGPEHLGGAFTEFVRVLDRPRRVSELERHLSGPEHGRPVGVQLMGGDPRHLASSAVNAVEAGAPLVDLNFGCPAKGALRGCAGSAQLKDPAGLEKVVRAVVEAVAGAVPVTAKIRAGYDHADGLEDLARATQNGGAALLTVHCRTRAEGYQPDVDWSRIGRVVEVVSIPVCGNGGVREHLELERMRTETGCALVMVGQAALGNPWLFSGKAVTRAEAAEFLLEYLDAMSAAGANPRGAAARAKQLLRHWTAGGLVEDENDRRTWLRESDPTELTERLRRATLKR
jgi:tRNA-dihydrouridine synthase C